MTRQILFIANVMTQKTQKQRPLKLSSRAVEPTFIKMWMPMIIFHSKWHNQQIKVNEKTGEFIIVLGERVLFRGIEGQFSILNLFTSLNIKHSLQRVDELPNDSDENLDKINI